MRSYAPETLERAIFDAFEAEVILAHHKESSNPAGFALFFHNFSTFNGRHGLYLEDLYVSPEFRGSGLGKLLLANLASIAEGRGCKRLEWWVLDNNTPAIDFYHSLGSEAMSDWTVHRLKSRQIKDLAEFAKNGAK